PDGTALATAVAVDAGSVLGSALGASTGGAAAAGGSPRMCRSIPERAIGTSPTRPPLLLTQIATTMTPISITHELIIATLQSADSPRCPARRDRRLACSFTSMTPPCWTEPRGVASFNSLCETPYLATVLNSTTCSSPASGRHL